MGYKKTMKMLGHSYNNFLHNSEPLYMTVNVESEYLDRNQISNVVHIPPITVLHSEDSREPLHSSSTIPPATCIHGDRADFCRHPVRPTPPLKPAGTAQPRSYGDHTGQCIHTLNISLKRGHIKEPMGGSLTKQDTPFHSHGQEVPDTSRQDTPLHCHGQEVQDTSTQDTTMKTYVVLERRCIACSR